MWSSLFLVLSHLTCAVRSCREACKKKICVSCPDVPLCFGCFVPVSGLMFGAFVSNLVVLSLSFVS